MSSTRSTATSFSTRSKVALLAVLGILLAMTVGLPATSARAAAGVVGSGGSVEFRGVSAVSANEVGVTGVVPAGVEAGDVLLAFVSLNRLIDVESVGSGWDLVGEQVSGSLVTRVYSRVAVDGDAGRDVAVALADVAKVDVVIAAYSGAAGVGSWASVGESTRTDVHVTPDLAGVAAGSRVVSYWVDKTSSSTGWSVPGGVQERMQTAGGGGGRLTTLTADALLDVAGDWSGKAATSSSSNPKATMWSIALEPTSR